MRSRLIDTNVLVYRFDPRDPLKQAIASRVLREGLTDDSLVLPHQAIIEFVAAVSRPRADLEGAPLLDQPDALREAESLILQFPMIYPNREVLTTALRGVAAYKLSWFDAHLWACAETFGIPEILSEDFEHGRHYGSVRINNPFLVGSGKVQQLPPLYGQGS
ncbi:PIN domain-containing protein [Wenzhouxiangella sp. AB-CW3]|uniref:PIN domain-containing protein n=1 Tax=Wenzhouxiangella sp. AB-CW3 TaxID=2771012 RepID=UPI00168B1926|nr:PIN domain-containing protein [Wenzhouxiangella sp. AB-CW3]QOC22223.1 PIN domain-containing protein [Wenzhouxiangella sp. AB-CW3]